MKKFALLIVTVFIIASCGNNTNDQLKEGKEVLTRYTNGGAQIERDYEIIDGKRIAVYEWEYYEDGNVLKEGPLDENEKRHGLWKAFFRNGNVWSEGGYENGIRQGITKTYHDNGKLFYEGEFNKAQKKGVWKFYDENGDFDYEIDYDARAKSSLKVDTANARLKKPSN